MDLRLALEAVVIGGVQPGYVNRAVRGHGHLGPLDHPLGPSHRVLCGLLDRGLAGRSEVAKAPPHRGAHVDGALQVRPPSMERTSWMVVCTSWGTRAGTSPR